MAVILFSAFISLFMLLLVLHNVDMHTKLRLVGYINPFDVAMHVTIFAMSGAASDAKVAAQLAGIMVTIVLRTWRRWYGFERLEVDPEYDGRWFKVFHLKWTRYAGTRT